MASGGSAEAGTLGGDAGDQALRRANGGVEGLARAGWIFKGLGMVFLTVNIYDNIPTIYGDDLKLECFTGKGFSNGEHTITYHNILW